MIDMASSPLSALTGAACLPASTAFDDSKKAPRVIFGGADIDDRDIGYGVIDGATQPLFDRPVAVSSPDRQPFGENVWRRSDQHHDYIGIGTAHRLDHRARRIDHDLTPGADIIVDRARQRIAM